MRPACTVTATVRKPPPMYARSASSFRVLDFVLQSLDLRSFSLSILFVWPYLWFFFWPLTCRFDQRTVQERPYPFAFSCVRFTVASLPSHCMTVSILFENMSFANSSMSTTRSTSVLLICVNWNIILVYTVKLDFMMVFNHWKLTSYFIFYSHSRI